MIRSGQEALARAAYPEALADLDRALGLWRGEVLADLAEYEFVSTLAARMAELRLAAIEARIEAQLALGRHQATATDLDQLIGRYPISHGYHAALEDGTGCAVLLARSAGPYLQPLDP